MGDAGSYLFRRGTTGAGTRYLGIGGGGIDLGGCGAVDGSPVSVDGIGRPCDAGGCSRNSGGHSFARASQLKDPQSVVVDEVAGQWITVLFAPVSWKTLLVGFILFRLFDILKPPPVRQLERLPEGVGIVMDDVAAGLYALLVLQLVLHFRILSL